jgi:hypothetical protein
MPGEAPMRVSQVEIEPVLQCVVKELPAVSTSGRPEEIAPIPDSGFWCPAGRSIPLMLVAKAAGAGILRCQLFDHAMLERPRTEQ